MQISGDLRALWSAGKFQLGIWETIYMTGLSTLVAYLIGLPLGIILSVTDKEGIKPVVWLNKILSVIVNVFRSIPFIILMVAMLPVAKAIVGSSIGNDAMIVMLVIAAAPYIARMVESSIKEIDKGVIEAAKSMGANTMQIVCKVMLPEAKPSLIVGAIISTVTVLGYSAMAGTIGGTGLGQIAIIYGHQRFNEDIKWLCVILMVVIVQIIQEIGMFIAKKSDRRLGGKVKKKNKNKNLFLRRYIIMKKLFKLFASAALALTLSCTAVACNNENGANGSNGNEDSYKITVGASSVPHAEILEQVKDDLADWGWTLDIVIFDDYVTPNTSLEEGDLDANYFQHEPYLTDFNAKNKTNIVTAAKIHYEPLGVYGKNVTQDSFDTNKTGRTILIPSDGSNCTRALFVLQQEGYITLKDGVTASDSLSDLDIADKKGNTITLIEANTIPAQLKNSNDGTIAVINGNYALEAELDNPLATESAEGEAAQLYANIIAVKKGDENHPKTKALKKALLSQEVYDYINNTYNGAVMPVFSL